MRNFFLIGIFLLLGGALVLFFLRSDDDISILDTPVVDVVDKPIEVAPTKKVSIPSLAESLPLLPLVIKQPDPVVISDPLILNEKDIATTEEKRFVISAKQWIRQYQLLMTYLRGSLSLEQIQDDGSVIVFNIHEEHENLKKMTNSLELPSSCSRANPYIQLLMEELDDIINQLSNPPTLQEMGKINPQTDHFFTIMNDLYRIVEVYCQ